MNAYQMFAIGIHVQWTLSFDFSEFSAEKVIICQTLYSKTIKTTEKKTQNKNKQKQKTFTKHLRQLKYN